MKVISEMTLDELRDYALELEDDKGALEIELAEQNKRYEDLSATNLMLQERNNKLFLQVEQGRRDEPAPAEEEAPQSCEDFASNNLKEIFK